MPKDILSNNKDSIYKSIFNILIIHSPNSLICNGKIDILHLRGCSYQIKACMLKLKDRCKYNL